MSRKDSTHDSTVITQMFSHTAIQGEVNHMKVITMRVEDEGMDFFLKKVTLLLIHLGITVTIL